ncbi:unnamed protein product [Hermetia illucens]|uniref:Protein FAM32A n=1 Tax=Hermetia illucens TaxID=343691 RepID=A0A7R8V3Y5_HERIL|nr:protein FAM32A-like [Hermetia illucens]CAD7091755.1 unnamed protein product [Hermetia illucens]
MPSEYDVPAGRLKLKSDSQIKKKKKKQEKREDAEKLEKAIQEQQNAETQTGTGRKLTNAELTFKKMQEKMQNKRILEKASMTHKQRVEKFNEHLDGLTEHFDIPKVSWTK